MTERLSCTGPTQSGEPCKAHVVPGTRFCRWHDPSPAGRARHRAESVRGGHAKAYGALPAGPALAEQHDTGALQLGTAAGLRDFLAATLHVLAGLPFDVRSAHAIAALVNAQRAIIDTSDLETRLAALEAAQHGAHLRVS